MSEEKKDARSGTEGMVPELRFPEFVGDGEWMEKIIEEVGDVVASGDLDKQSFSNEKSDKHKFPIYSNSVSDEGLYGYNLYAKYPAGSVTITARGTLGVAFVRNSEFVGIGRLLVVSNLIKTAPVFLKENWNHNAKIDLENGGIPQLTAIKAKKAKLLFPKYAEQQKIAACLSSLDELIAAHQEKLAALKEHKKGLMQHLFPSAGETMPKVRFPEFLGDGEWVEKKLGDVLEFTMGNAFKSKDFVATGTQLIRMGNLYQGELQLERSPVFLPKSFETEYSAFIVHPGDLLMSMTGTIGKTDYGFIVQIPEKSTNFLLNQRVVKILPKPIYEKGFILQLMKNEMFLKTLYSLSGGTKQANLSTKEMKNIIVFLPSLPEQQKIASCLSAVDELITAQAEKIEQLQQHKKGLMQGLFPGSITN